MLNEELHTLLCKQPGWQEWMSNWIEPSPCDDSLCLTLFVCYHPDNCQFYASTDPAQAVAAFSREEFTYNG